MIDKLTRSPHTRFYVVDEEGHLCGAYIGPRPAAAGAGRDPVSPT